MHKGLTTALAVAALALGAAAAPAGAELLPVDTGDGGAEEIEPTVCQMGVLVECGTQTSRRCTQWVTVNASGSISIVPTGGTVSGTVSGSGQLTCGTWTETTIKVYKDKYKAKTS